MALSELRDQVFFSFVPGIAFEFELKVLAVLEFQYEVMELLFILFSII